MFFVIRLVNRGRENVGSYKMRKETRKLIFYCALHVYLMLTFDLQLFDSFLLTRKFQYSEKNP